MNRRPTPAPTNRFPHLSRIALLGASTCLPMALAASSPEHTNIETMIRQLNALEDTARRSAKFTDEPGRRFYLDYQRLTGDIKRIRQGLESYLTPSRAQPRDPVEIFGSYTRQQPGDS